MAKNKNWFKSDVEELRKVFPDIYHLPELNNFFRLAGSLPIYDKNSALRGVFLVEIHFNSDYRKGFGKLYEIGDEIKKSPDWHKYEDNECCICALPEELIERGNFRSALNFVYDYVIPFFANHLHKVEYGFYPNGEWAHGDFGTIQWYKEKLNGLNLTEILLLLEAIFMNRMQNRKSVLCFCGSGRRLKKCHIRIYSQLNRIPKKALFEHILKIRNHLNLV